MSNKNKNATNSKSIKVDFDYMRSAITEEHSLLNGEELLKRDENDVEVAYRYDQLGRVISETSSPGIEFEASRRYPHNLSEEQIDDI